MKNNLSTSEYIDVNYTIYLNFKRKELSIPKPHLNLIQNC